MAVMPTGIPKRPWPVSAPPVAAAVRHPLIRPRGDAAPNNSLAPSRLEAALQLARDRGWPVFPCKGKEPLTAHGFKDASADADQIERWWTDNPSANIGVATGAVSGIAVLDIDTKAGKDGEASLRQLLNGHEALPPTLEQRTPSGGRHVIFAATRAKIACSTGQLGEGLDVRGDGGYIIVAPSDGYSWVNNLPPQPWPSVLSPQTKERTGAGLNAPLRRIAAALEHLDPNNRDLWLKVGWAISRATRQAQAGFDMWLEWSARSRKHDPQRDPDHMHREYFEVAAEPREAPITLASMFLEARKAGWKDDELLSADQCRLARNALEMLELQSGRRPVYTQGAIYVVAPGTGLWRPCTLDQMAVTVGELHGGLKYCVRNSDFVAIARLAASMIDEDRFFYNAAIGVAAPGGFWRVTDGGEILHEDLTPEHRQRTLLAADPDPDTKPERWLKMLREAFAGHDPDGQIRLMSQLFGSAITRSLWRHRIVGLLLGPTSSGKSTALSVLRQAFAQDQVCAVTPQRWSHEYFVASLAGKALNIVGELDARDSIPGGAFKTITGKDLVEGRHVTHRPFSFRCEAAHLFNSNSAPPTNDHSDAFFRRWRIVLFSNTVPAGKEIRDLDEQIVRDELGAFLWWALQGAADVVRTDSIIEPEPHREELAKWRSANNSALQFVLDKTECVITPIGRLVRPKATTAQVLFDRYKIFCASNGLRPFGRNNFIEALTAGAGAVGIRRVDRNNQAVFEGVQLRGGP